MTATKWVTNSAGVMVYGDADSKKCSVYGQVTPLNNGEWDACLIFNMRGYQYIVDQRPYKSKKRAKRLIVVAVRETFETTKEFLGEG